MQKLSRKRTSDVRDTEKESCVKKAKVFCGREFRKELKKENLIPCLKNFLKIAEEHDDGQIVNEYLQAGGSVQEILLLLDQTAKADLVSALPVFKVLHLIFISIKDSDSRYYDEAKVGAKFMLDSFISTIEAMMNINSNKHRKVILKVLTSVVTLFPTYARDIMTLIPNSASVLSQFLRPQSGKDSLRSWSIFFILSFLVGGDFTLIRTVLNMKSLLADIINDLEFDEAHTVNVFLSVIQEKVLENVKVTKSLKLKVFNTQVVTSLFKVYNWKGPKNITVGSSSSKKGSKEKEVNQGEKELVTESIHNFLTVLCTSKKFGIIFSDSSFGTDGESKNNLLCTVFRSIPEPWENNKMSEMVIKIILACPELMNVILHRMESVIQPRNSKKWNTLLQFVERLLEAVSPGNVLAIAAAASEIDIVQLAKQFCTPAVLMHSLSLGLRNRTCLPVLYYSMRVLSLLWKKTAEVLVSFGSHDKIKKTLTSSFNNCLVELNDILDTWKDICSSSTLSFDYTDKKNFLNVILDFLEMNSKCDRNLNDSPSRIASEMLESLDPIRESLGADDFNRIQSKIFYLITWVDPMSVTPDSDIFRRAMLLLFNNKSKSTIESLTKIILSTGVFENCESEIDIWLACYFDRFDQYHNFLPSIFTDSICQLYLKEFNFAQNFMKNFSKRRSVFTELMEIDSSDLLNKKWVRSSTETPTPMLVKLLEILKNLMTSEKKREKKLLKNYIKQVTLRLFHYYNNSEALVKFCLQYENELGDSVLDYMTGKRRTEIFSDDTFLTSEEKDLMSWILKRNKHFSFENSIKKEDGCSLRLFLIFNMVVSYLLSQVNEDCLSCEDVTKFSRFFSFFMNLESVEEITVSSYSNILSYDVDNLNFLRAKCIQHIFSLPLVDKFDLFEYENRAVMNFTKLMASVIMEMNKEDIKRFSSILPWKEAFLKKITTNLRDNNKTLEIFGNVEPLVDCFHYNSSEISTILNDYSSITDTKIFVAEGKLTMSTMILTKFIRLHSDHSELGSECLRQLWNIVQCMNGENSDNFEIIDNCYVEILKKRPKSIALIDNDFVEWLLNRSDFSEETLLLGNLLLSDPNKVKYFITFAKTNFKELKNKKIIVAMLSTLVRKEDKFLDLLRLHKFCCYWKESELVSEEENPELCKLLKLTYKKYKGCIFNCDYKNMDFILKYSEFFSMLMKLFHEEELVSELKDIVGSGKFAPEIMHRVVLKYQEMEDLVEAYVQGLLILFYDKAKEVENARCDELIWKRYSKYICDISSIESNFNRSKITESAMWKDFIRLCLRICFKFPDCPSFLKTVRCFFELLYKPGENSRDIAIIFELLISHSQFLSSMLQNSLLKEELVSFYYSIIRRNTEVLSVKHIPIILASYSASLSKNDVALLNILRFYEENNIVMNEYEPLVWGELAVTHYSVKSNVGVSLWRRVSMLNVLELLDFRRIEVSMKEFPIYRNFKEDEDVIVNDKVYDPVFLLHIFANLLSPGAVTFCLPFVQKGCFAFTVCALSSLSKEIRITASLVLARFYNHLELVQSMKLKSVWLHFINCLRYAIEDIKRKPLPSIVTYFLAKTSLEISGEPGEMFTSLQKFLLAKPVFNFEYIPEFLPFFHSSDTQYMKQRRWLLEVLRDGFKQNVDLDLLFQTMAVKLILSYFRSQFCSKEIKILILEKAVVQKKWKQKVILMKYGQIYHHNLKKFEIVNFYQKKFLEPFLDLKFLNWEVECLKNFGSGINILKYLVRKVAQQIHDLRVSLLNSVFTGILKADKAKLLISEYGFLTWLNAVCLNCDQELFTPFVKLVSSALAVTKDKLVDDAPEERNLIYPIQILNILMKILPNLRQCRVTDTHEIFSTVVLNCLMMLLQFDHKSWCKSNRESLVEFSKITVKVLGDESLHEKLEKSKFFFGFIEVPSNLELLHRKIMFLGDVLTDFR